MQEEKIDQEKLGGGRRKDTFQMKFCNFTNFQTEIHLGISTLGFDLKDYRITAKKLQNRDFLLSDECSWVSGKRYLLRILQGASREKVVGNPFE